MNSEIVKVSIIIPVYNLENELPSCLYSCINQSFKELEIIVVNDGSDDKSEDIIHEFRNKDKRIVYICKKNEGLIAARSTGVENARGEYLFHLDGDDTIPNDSIEKLYELAISTDADIVVGNFALYKNSNLYEIRKYSWFDLSTGEKFLDHILKNRLHYLCGKLIKNTLYTSNTIYIPKEVSIGEDQVQMIQLCMVSDRVIGVESIVYNYVLRDESMTRRSVSGIDYSANQFSYAEALNSIKERFTYSKNIKQQINLRIINALNQGVLCAGKYSGGRNNLRLVHFKTCLDFLFSNAKVSGKRIPLSLKSLISVLIPSVPYFYHKLKIFVKT